MLPPQEYITRDIGTGITSVGNSIRKDLVTAPKPKRKAQLLDAGEGKIHVSAAASLSDDGNMSEVGVGENEDLKLIHTRNSEDHHDKVREGESPYLQLQRTLDSGSSISDTMYSEKEKCAHSDSPNSEIVKQTITGESDGLRPPQLSISNAAVLGKEKGTLRKQNKARRIQATASQPPPTSTWSTFHGEFYIPGDIGPAEPHEKQMYPSGLAATHPAGPLLKQWSEFGCPTMTGKPWTREEMAAAIARGPHKSALSEAAILHFATEINEKVAAGQAKVILWSDILDNPPEQLKISPVAAVPHNSKPFRSILDLSFTLKLTTGKIVPSVNDTTTKTAPQASVDQLGHSLLRLINAFAEAAPTDKIFMAKWDVKDGFWRLDCQEGEEYNFAYVLPQQEGEPIKLVVPTSLQMGWIESPAYFCTASETSRDVATQYCQAPLSSLPPHKFEKYMRGSDAFNDLPVCGDDDSNLRFMLEVFVDDFMDLVIATSQRQLEHVGTGTMMGIHDVFPPADESAEDPISEKKMKKLDAQFDTRKTLLGFDFDGIDKTIWLQEDKRSALLLILKGWLRSSRRSNAGIPFKVFESVTAKLRHAFTTIPAGLGLLSPCNRILALRPAHVFLHRNKELYGAILDIRTLLRQSVTAPTKCVELVSGWPDFIGYTDASGVGFGGIIIGEGKQLQPTVFRGQWPPDIRAELVSPQNPTGSLSINDLEMAGFLITWLVMEEIIDDMRQTNIALFSDNSPSVSWVERMASKRSVVGSRLIRALALRMKMCAACPLTPLHVAGKRNSMADMASRSFGTVPHWHCRSDSDFARMFDNLFPLPSQNTWAVFRPTNEIFMKVISILRMKASTLDEWQRIPRIGQHTGKIGAPMSDLWEWTRTYNIHPTQNDAGCSLVSQHGHVQDTTAEEDKSNLRQSLQLSRPLGRRSLWNVRETH